NQEAFISHQLDKDLDSRLYKTGDIVRLAISDDIPQLLYQGRRDYQVKLRGLRIELGEIEHALSSLPEIKDATVLVDHDELLAFVLGEQLESSNWRELLQQRLPDFMLPKSLTFLASWPLTPNGKIDRQALLAMPRKQVAGNQFVAPRTSLERDLSAVWKEVLGVGDIGIHDNFFDSGGDSLKAVRLIARLEMHFEVKLPVSSLFGAQTIAQLAHVIHNDIHDWSPLVPIQPQGDKTPIFAIHALGAMVLSYEPLARALGKRQPFYGLQAYGFEEDQTPFTDLHEMISFYTKAILEQQAKGPYQLIGHSFGGLLAIEIARKLIAMGHEVSFLALLDTHKPIEYQSIELDDAGILKTFAEHNFGVVDIPLRTLRLMKPEQMIHNVARQFNGAVSESFISSAIDIIRGFQRMMINYKPEPLPLAIHLYKPEDQQQTMLSRVKQRLFKQQQQSLGWHKVFTEITIHDVAGDHFSMLNGSHAEALAANLKAELSALHNQLNMPSDNTEN
ncbi:MAG: hypothetical protein HRU21_13480, partial [Pseudomonadales bacterium]|nr:hypothetical protein [Pseudomonadales bacterium]